MSFNKYRIIKSCKNAWYIIEPTRQSLLRDEKYNNLVKFESKEQALTYCKENNLEISTDYSDIELNGFRFIKEEESR